MVMYTKIVVTDTDSNDFTVGSEGRGGNLTLRDNYSSVLTFNIQDADGSFETKYEVGSRVIVYMDSSNPPTTKVFRGIINNISTSYDENRRFVFECGEEFANIIFNTVIYDSPNYINQTVGSIVIDLFNRYTTGFDLTGVQDTDVTINDISLPYMTLEEALLTLSDLGDTQFYSSPNLELFFYPKQSLTTAISYGTTDIKGPVIRTTDLTSMTNSVYVLGGNNILEDQKQDTTGSSVDMDSNFIAVKLTPTENNFKELFLYLKTVGTPITDLTGSLRESDSGGLPGAKVRTFRFKASDMTSSLSWVFTLLNTPLITERDYWIVVDKNGSAGDTYAWGHDNSGANSHGTSADGLSWALTTSSFEPTFKQWFGLPLVSHAFSQSLITKFGRRDSVIINTDIVDKATSVRLAKAAMARFSRSEVRLEEFTVLNQTEVPQVGKSVFIRINNLNIAQHFFVKEVFIPLIKGAEVVDSMVMRVSNRT